jgi:hypothetical protein
MAGSGFSPSSNQTSNLPQSTVRYYDKRFIENLKSQTPFVRCCERRELPMNSGTSLELFMYSPFGANVNQAGEGTVTSGIQASVLTTVATIGEYARLRNWRTKILLYR